jgi:hypothetical protein
MWHWAEPCTSTLTTTLTLNTSQLIFPMVKSSQFILCVLRKARTFIALLAQMKLTLLHFITKQLMHWAKVSPQLHGRVMVLLRQWNTTQVGYSQYNGIRKTPLLSTRMRRRFTMR